MNKGLETVDPLADYWKEEREKRRKEAIEIKRDDFIDTFAECVKFYMPDLIRPTALTLTYSDEKSATDWKYYVAEIMSFIAADILEELFD